MKRIGLTQRVEVVAAYNERRDCLDQNWVVMMLNLGFLPVPLPNLSDCHEAKNYLDALQLDGVILTGGNDLAITQSPQVAKERDAFEGAVLEYCAENRLPVLGVCRGMQMMNIHWGGSVSKVTDHVCPDHTIVVGKESHQVNSYHNWAIKPEELGADMEPLGFSNDGLVEYAKHIQLPMRAIMWHPERANQDSEIGFKIIKELFT